MSYDLNSYFQLGLDSATNPQSSLVMNTIRTPVDSQSGRSGLSRVTFKVPKVGLITGDSMITLQFIQNGTPSTANVTPNFISGALGCIERCRILVDNKVLTDLEKPSLLEIPKMYSRATQNEVAQYQNKFLANEFETDVVPISGLEQFDNTKTRYFTAADKTTDFQNVVRHRPSTEALSHVYGLHLKNLGAEFLENESLPVFLLGAQREMIIELYIHTDCREYLVPTMGTLSADDYVVNYANVELVTTHVQIPDDVQASEIANLQTQPVSYPLIDNYVVKGNRVMGADGTTDNKVFRINAQNRELHKLLMVNTNVSTQVQDNNRVVGNQKAIALGDESLQIKSNGLNLFERPITSQSLLYQQTTYAHNGMALKLPMNACRVDTRVKQMPPMTDNLGLNYRGNAKYLAIDFTNGNGGVYGGGSVQKQAMEIEHNVTPTDSTNPIQQNRTFNSSFYLSVSKLLTIGARNVEISF
jgi:hypothetical protein